MNAVDLGIPGFAAVDVLDGSRSSVFRARDLATDQDVAIKILERHHEPILPRRLGRTNRALTRLVSENVGFVPLVKTGVSAAGNHFVVMPYYQYGSLDDQMTHGPTPWQLAVEIVALATGPVIAAHRSEITLGDLRPSAILLDDDRRPLVSLYGMATRRFDDGRPTFLAPEVLAGKRGGQTGDVYSLTATLAALIRGEGRSRAEGTEQILADLAPLCSDELTEVIKTGLADEPSARFAHAELLRAALLSTIDTSIMARLHELEPPALSPLAAPEDLPPPSFEDLIEADPIAEQDDTDPVPSPTDTAREVVSRNGMPEGLEDLDFAEGGDPELDMLEELLGLNEGDEGDPLEAPAEVEPVLEGDEGEPLEARAEVEPILEGDEGEPLEARAEVEPILESDDTQIFADTNDTHTDDDTQIFADTSNTHTDDDTQIFADTSNTHTDDDTQIFADTDDDTQIFADTSNTHTDDDTQIFAETDDDTQIFADTDDDTVIDLREEESTDDELLNLARITIEMTPDQISKLDTSVTDVPAEGAKSDGDETDDDETDGDGDSDDDETDGHPGSGPGSIGTNGDSSPTSGGSRPGPDNGLVAPAYNGNGDHGDNDADRPSAEPALVGAGLLTPAAVAFDDELTAVYGIDDDGAGGAIVVDDAAPPPPPPALGFDDRQAQAPVVTEDDSVPFRSTDVPTAYHRSPIRAGRWARFVTAVQLAWFRSRRNLASMAVVGGIVAMVGLAVYAVIGEIQASTSSVDSGRPVTATTIPPGTMIVNPTDVPLVTDVPATNTTVRAAPRVVRTTAPPTPDPSKEGSDDANKDDGGDAKNDDAKNDGGDDSKNDDDSNNEDDSKKPPVDEPKEPAPTTEPPTTKKPRPNPPTTKKPTPRPDPDPEPEPEPPPTTKPPDPEPEPDPPPTATPPTPPPAPDPDEEEEEEEEETPPGRGRGRG